MVDEDKYCVDILTQIRSVVSASEKVATILLKDHVEHCVRESIEKGERTRRSKSSRPPWNGS